MKIKKNEVARYLACQIEKLDERMNVLIDECIEELMSIEKSKFTYKIFDIEKRETGIEVLQSTLLFTGNDIENHLKQSSKCAIMAVTLGSAVESKIRYYEKTNLTKSLILDACATAAVESVCDECEESIQNAAKEYGLGITYRYSPGYGDFSIEAQRNIVKVLECEKQIGLTVTEQFILLPRKSVTAIIGLQAENIKRVHPGCAKCGNKEKCIYRRDGEYCEN